MLVKIQDTTHSCTDSEFVLYKYIFRKKLNKTDCTKNMLF